MMGSQRHEEPKMELLDLLVENSKSARDSLLTPQQHPNQTTSDGYELRANLLDSNTISHEIQMVSRPATTNKSNTIMIQNDSAEFVPTPPANSSIFNKNVHLKNN